MARGAAQTRRKRTKADARRRRRRAQATAPAPIASQTMFFPRLRRSAKWVFLALAIVFAAGFTIFGVGSGSGFGGISELWNNNNNTTKSSVSETAARKRIQQNPNDVQAYRDLAEALQVKGDLQGAVVALRHVTRLRPGDVLGSGTLTGGCILELGIDWLKDGDTVTLAAPGLLGFSRSWLFMQACSSLS